MSTAIVPGNGGGGAGVGNEVGNGNGGGTAAPGMPRNRFSMDGVGARVIRGPDWKWGKQVSQ